MLKAKIVCDYYDGKELPIWFVIDGIDWTKQVMYLPIEAPFERIHLHEFDNEMLSASVTIDDFVVNYAKPNHIGIKLHEINERINEYGIDRMDIKQLVLLAADLEEVLHMGRR